MAITNSNDLTHIVRTTSQWKSTYDAYDTIPLGVLCVELTPEGSTKIKIGDGHNVFAKLPYVGGQAVLEYYSKRETDERIKEVLNTEHVMRIKGVLSSEASLPSNPAIGDVYFVLSRSSSSYIEYIYSPNHSWIPLGGSPVDVNLSEYTTKEYVNEQIDEVNTRIDEIVKGGTSSHTHDNKDILDSTTASFTKEDKAKLDSMSSFTSADRDKLNVLIKNSTSFEKIAALEKLAHEHSNKRILDRITAAFTVDYEQKMKWIRPYTGAENGYEGIMGLVPPAQPGEEDYVLNGAGEWVPMEGGEAAELTPATTSKLGGIIVGKGLKVDQFGILSTEENENNCDCDNVGHFDRTSGTPGTGEIFNSYSGMYMNKATGQYSHAEGMNANASGFASHAEGINTKVEADHAHVEGQGHHIHKSSDDSHAEGADNEIFARAAHAEGQGHKVYGENAHAEGWDTDALGPRSHTEGYQTSAGVYDESYPSAAHAEGIQTTAVSQGSHAEGYKSYAGLLPKRISSDNDGYYAHAEGNHTYAYGHASHAEGNGTTASGKNAHSEGRSTTASGHSSHAEGTQTTASGEGSHSEGETTTASGGDSHAEGYNTTASGNRSHTEGMSTTASSDEAHAEGIGTTASGNYSHAEGSYTNATKDSAHAEGYGGRKITDAIPNFSSSTTKAEIVEAWGTDMSDGFTLASEMGAHAEGYHTLALGTAAHAEGDATHALGNGSHSEGHTTKAEGTNSHAEGDETRAIGMASHAEGKRTATLDGHSEGYSSAKLYDVIPTFYQMMGNDPIIAAWENSKFTFAKDYGAHAEGFDTLALGQASHTEGYGTMATATSAHAEGRDSRATGNYSHAQGNYTIANGESQFTLGKFNIPDDDEKYAVIVGGGTNNNNRKNIFTIDWSGNIELGVSDADGNITYGTINGVDITNITVNGVTDINESEENNTITVVFSDGTSKDIAIKCNGGSSETPIATTETPGVVKPGKGLEVLEDGTLNVIVDTDNSNVGGYEAGEAIEFADNSVSTIPAMYQEIEYFETDGSQTFNLGYVPNNTTKVVIDVNIGLNTGRPFSSIFGARLSPHKNDFLIFNNYISDTRSGYGCSSESEMTEITKNERIIISYSPQVLSWNRQSTDELITSIPLNRTISVSYPLFLFDLNNGGSPDNSKCAAKFYSFKIYEYNEMIHEFIPVYRKSDDVIGLFDTCENKFIEPFRGTVTLKGDEVNYHSINTPSINVKYDPTTLAVNENNELTVIGGGSGIGEVTAGPGIDVIKETSTNTGSTSTIVKKQYTTLEYVQSNGTQKIVTDLFFNEENMDGHTYIIETNFYTMLDMDRDQVFIGMGPLNKTNSWMLLQRGQNSSVSPYREGYSSWKYCLSDNYGDWTGSNSGSIPSMLLTGLQKTVVNVSKSSFGQSGWWSSYNGYGNLSANPVKGPLTIFGAEDTDDANGICTIGYIKMSERDVAGNVSLLHHLVPVVDADGTVGFIDKLTNKFYGPTTGSGLLSGPVTEEIIEIETEIEGEEPTDEAVKSYKVSLKPATDTEIGGVRPGTGLEVNSDGAINVKYGDGLSVNEDNELISTGVLDVKPSEEKNQIIITTQDGDKPIDILIDQQESAVYKPGKGIEFTTINASLEDYVPLEYIENITDYDYIVTDFYPTSNSDFEIDAVCYREGSHDVKCLIGVGARNEGWVNEWALCSSWADYKFHYRTGSYKDKAFDIPYNTRFTAKTSGYNISFYDVEGNPLGTYSTDYARTNDGSIPISLFALQQEVPDHIYDIAHGKIYSVKFYENGALVRKYVPCYRKSDGVVGIMDVLSNTFHGNGHLDFNGGDQDTTYLQRGPETVWPDVQNTINVKYDPNTLAINENNELTVIGGKGGGSSVNIVAGDNIQIEDVESPEKYQVVEYIQSDGYERIKTDIYLNASPHIFNLKYQFDEWNADSQTIYCVGATSENGSQIYGMFANQIAAALVDSNGTEWHSRTKQISLNTEYVDTVEESENRHGSSIVGIETHSYPFKSNGRLHIMGIPYDTPYEGEIDPSKTVITKLWYMRITDGDKLAADLVPVIRMSDNKVGLYDKVSDKFYTNTYSNYPFIAGNPTGEIIDSKNAIKISAIVPEPYELPKASEEVLGGVKIGDGLEILPDGTINVVDQGITEYIEGEAIGIVKKSKSIIPEEYQQVEWIRSNGSEYINLDYTTLPETVIKMRFTGLTSDKGWGCLIGSRSGPSGSGAKDQLMFLIHHYQAGNVTEFWVGSSDKIRDSEFPYQQMLDLEIKNSVATYTIVDTGEVRTLEAPTAMPISTHPLYLFSLDNGGKEEAQRVRAMVYDLEIYEGDRLVRHFIPVYEKSTGIGGLYETEKGVFVSSLTTSQVTYGDDKDSEEIIQKEINVRYGDGLAVNENNELIVKTGKGLTFDEDGTLNVTVAPIIDGVPGEGYLIKSFTYTGDGSNDNYIQFPEKPISILNIYGKGMNGNWVSSTNTPIDQETIEIIYGGGSSGAIFCKMAYDDDTDILHIYGGNTDVGGRFNVDGEEYTVLYITPIPISESFIFKTLTYTGNGNDVNNIEFPEKPEFVVSMYGYAINNWITCESFELTSNKLMYQYGGGSNAGVGTVDLSFDEETNTLSLSRGGDRGAIFNVSGEEYVIRYAVKSTVYATSNGSSGYELPIASDETLGGIKVGEGLSIDSNGVLSFKGSIREYVGGIATDVHETILGAEVIDLIPDGDKDVYNWENGEYTTETSNSYANGWTRTIRHTKLIPVDYAKLQGISVKIINSDGVETPLGYHISIFNESIVHFNEIYETGNWYYFYPGDGVKYIDRAKIEEYPEFSFVSVNIRSSTNPQYGTIDRGVVRSVVLTLHYGTDDKELYSVDVKYDPNTLAINENNELTVIGGGSGGTSGNIGVKSETGLSVSIEPNGGVLGEDLIKLSYIRNNGDAYIATDYIPQPNTRIVIEYSINTGYVRTDQALIGSRNGSSSGSSQFVFWTGKRSESSDILYQFVYGGNVSGNVPIIYLSTIKPGDKIIADMSKYGLYINGENVHNVVDTGSPSPYPITVFACGYNSTGTSTSYAPGSYTVYHVQIYEDNELVRDYIPAYHKTQGPGLYDMITGVFHGSANSYSFAYDSSYIGTDGVLYNVDLLPATPTSLGGVIPGKGLSIDSNGVINVSERIITGVDINFTADTGLQIHDTSEYGFVIPENYALISYIENPSNAYAALDYYVSSNTRIVARASFKKGVLSSNGVVFGSRNDTSNKEYVLWVQWQSSTYPLLRFANGTQGWSSINGNAGIPIDGYKEYQIVTLETIPTDGLYVDGVKIQECTGGTFTPGSYAMHIGDLSGSNYRAEPMRIHSVQIFEGESLKLNLVPVLNSEGIAGLYDTVRGKFFGSNNSTNYIYDADSVNTMEVEKKISLLPATATTIGGIKVGNGLTISPDGVLSVTNAVPPASPDIPTTPTDPPESYGVMDVSVTDNEVGKLDILKDGETTTIDIFDNLESLILNCTGDS